jgi:hypothetical protein
MTHTFRFFTGAEDYAQKIAIYGDQVLPAGWATDGVTAYYSSRSYKWTCASGSNEWEVPLYIDTNGRWAYPANYGMTCYWVTFHLYIASLPGAGQYVYFMRFADADTKSQFRIDQNGAIQVYNKNGASWSTASVGHLSAANWYVVSVKHYKAGEARCIVRDAVTEAEVINVVHANVTPNENVQFCKIGGASAYGVYYFDNIAVEAAATSAEVDDPFLVLGGAYGALQLKANGDGTDTSANWSGSYADVDENPKDDDATYRYCSLSSAGPITHHVQNPGDVATYPIATIVALDVALAGRSITGDLLVFVRLRRGASAWNSPTSWAWTLGSGYVQQCYLWQIDPTDTLPWTESRVIECEAGLATTYNVNTYGRLTANYIDVLATFQIAPTPQQRLVHYTLDENDPEQRIVDNNGLTVPPEELRADRWLQLVGGRAPATKVFTDFLDDPSMVPIKVMRFTEPDQYSIGSASDDLLEAILGGITGRVL